MIYGIYYMDGLAQDKSDTIDNALDLLQSCAKPLMSKWHVSLIVLWRPWSSKASKSHTTIYRLPSAWKT